MATNARTATTSRIPMSSMRKTALVAGVLYLLTFISSIPAVFLQSPVLTDPNFIIGGAGADTQVRLGALFDIVNSLTAIGTAVALYAVIKRQNQGFAIGFVSSRLFEGTVLMIGVISILSIVTLQQPGATGAEASLLVNTQQTLVTVRNWTFVLGTGVPALNAVPARLDHVQVAPRPACDPGDRAHRRAAVHLLDRRLRPRRHRARHRLARDRGRADLHLGAVARPVDDLQGLPQGRAADGRGRRGGRRPDGSPSVTRSPIGIATSAGAA